MIGNDRPRRFDNENRHQARQIAEQLRDQMRGIERALYSIGNDPVFVTFRPITKPGDDVSQTYRIMTIFELEQHRWPYISSLYYVNPRYDRVIAFPQGAYPITEFFDRSWMEELPSQFNWLHLPQRRASDRTVERWPLASHPFSTQYSILHSTHGDGLLMVNLLLEPMLERILADHGPVHVRLLGAGGTQLARANDADADGRQYRLAVGYQDWTLELVAPLSRLERMRRQVFLILAAVLTLQAALLAFWMRRIGRRIARPIDQLCDELDRIVTTSERLPVPRDSQLGRLRTLFQSLQAEDMGMQTRIEIYQTIELAALLRSYLAGQISHSDLLNRSQDFPRFSCSTSYRLALCLSQSSEEPDDHQDAWLRQLQADELTASWLERSDCGHLLRLDATRSLLLFRAPEASEAQTTWIQALSLLRSSAQENCYLALAPVAEPVADLPARMRVLEQRLDDAVFFEVDYVDSDRGADIKSAPTREEVAQQLIRAIRANHEDGVLEGISMLCLRLEPQLDAQLARHELALLCADLKRQFSNHFSDFDQLIRLVPTVDQLSILLSELNRTCLQVARSLRDAQSSGNQYIEAVQAYIHRHYRDDIRSDDLAALVKLSYPYLSQLFRQACGCTIMDYLNAYRVNRALVLIEAQDMGVDALARAVGFGSRQILNRYFKRETGMTVSEFRRYGQGRIAEGN